MKKVITFTLALIALTLLSISVLLTTKRYSAVSEVYHHYKGHDDLCVGFVKDYRIDDSTTVDVTTITARDSASWEALLREMNVKSGVIKRMRDALNDGRYTLTGHYCELGHPEHQIPYDESGCWYVYFNPTEKTIYIFHLNHEKATKIIRHKIKEVRENAPYF